MAHGMPRTFERDNDGSTLYRINVEQEYDPEEPEKQIGWKCFEIRVYNWIKENARTTLDAYLMLSTAFSKWKGNNMLSSYYNKLFNNLIANIRKYFKLYFSFILFTTILDLFLLLIHLLYFYLQSYL